MFVTLLAVDGPHWAPHDPNHQYRQELLNDNGEPLQPFSEAFPNDGSWPERVREYFSGHILGADSTGRDELSRLLYGGQVSMMVAYFATLLAVFIGVFAGVTSGYFGGWIDFAWMRGVDLLLSLPFLLLAIAIQSVVADTTLVFLIFLLALLSWTRLARVTRAKVMQVRQLEYVQAAEALGMSHARILLRHVLPNVLGPIIVLGTTLVARMIIFESALSFLGLGVEPPDASWGSMLNEGRLELAYPHLMIFPAVLIVATVFGFNLLGEGLRDAFDPKE